MAATRWHDGTPPKFSNELKGVVICHCQSFGRPVAENYDDVQEAAAVWNDWVYFGGGWFKQDRWRCFWNKWWRRKDWTKTIVETNQSYSQHGWWLCNACKVWTRWVLNGCCMGGYTSFPYGAFPACDAPGSNGARWCCRSEPWEHEGKLEDGLKCDVTAEMKDAVSSLRVKMLAEVCVAGRGPTGEWLINDEVII